MRGSIRLGDVVSLSRVGLAALFLVTFRASFGETFLISLGSAVLAQLSDHLDGYLVRRFSVPNVTGWVLDSFADRAFYIAAVLAFERELGFNEVLAWAFILREVCLYAIRVLVGDFQSILPSFRILALIHAGVIRFGIVVACTIPLLRLEPQMGVDLATAVQWLFGLATAIGYLNLVLLFRALERRPTHYKEKG